MISERDADVVIIAPHREQRQGLLVEPRPGQIAFCTLPPFRQRVQTYARVGLPRSSTRTRWRFGLKRRFVATMEWLRL
jgi:hypothetical protein